MQFLKHALSNFPEKDREPAIDEQPRNMRVHIRMRICPLLLRLRDWLSSIRSANNIALLAPHTRASVLRYFTYKSLWMEKLWETLNEGKYDKLLAKCSKMSYNASQNWRHDFFNYVQMDMEDCQCVDGAVHYLGPLGRRICQVRLRKIVDELLPCAAISRKTTKLEQD